MATKIGEAFVDVTARLDKYNSGLKNARGRLGGFEKKTAASTKRLGGSFSALGASLPLVGFASLALAFRKIFTLTEKQQAAEAQLNAVLKSTKGIAGLTAKELTTMASSLQQVSVFGDETIIKAQSILLTFTKIGSDIFPQATQSILDMSQALGTDLQSSTIQVGKALNDPIQGVAALRRVGVQLTEQQEDMVKQLVETGDVAKAQGIILSELETQFGGAAEAATKTLGGSLAQLKNTIGDLFEKTGTGFSDSLIEGFNKLNVFLKENEQLFSDIGEIMGEVFDLSMELWGVIADLASIFNEVFGPAVRSAIGALGDFKDSIIDVIDEMRGIEHEYELIEKLAGDNDEENAKRFKKQQARRQKASEEWLKMREEARRFSKDMAQILEAPEQTIARQREENLAQLEVYNKKKMLTVQQYNDARVAINVEAENQLSELRRQRHEEEMQLANESLSKTSEMLGLIGEAIAVDEENRLSQIDVRREKKLKQLDSEFEKESTLIRKSIKNKKKADKAIAKLEDERAKKETEINERSDKEKAKIQRKAFEREKAFRIVGAIIATSQAIMSALAGPFPASIAFAALAGVMGAIQIGIIAAQKPPALADGGIAIKDTIARIGEAGEEAVFPLSGQRGQKTTQMLADNIVNSIAGQQERVQDTKGFVEEEQELTFNVSVNIGSDELYGSITQGIRNREIIIEGNDLTKR